MMQVRWLSSLFCQVTLEARLFLSCSYCYPEIMGVIQILKLIKETYLVTWDSESKLSILVAAFITTVALVLLCFL
jgi:hypothetical protein